jgi:hypothetical protein
MHAADLMITEAQQNDFVLPLYDLNSVFNEQQPWRGLRPALAMRIRKGSAAQLKFSVPLHDFCRLRP